jgi:AcrR family transcriptional regulator
MSPSILALREWPRFSAARLLGRDGRPVRDSRSKLPKVMIGVFVRVQHFGSKEALFVEIVASMTNDAGDLVVDETPEPDDVAELAGYLRAYAAKQLTVVLTPRLMRLRRLVIGEVSRFPDLARVLYERGPQRAQTKLTAMFERLAARGLLTLDDASVAATQFNWVIMADPLNRAMLLGDEAIPAPSVLRRTGAIVRCSRSLRRRAALPRLRRSIAHRDRCRLPRGGSRPPAGRGLRPSASR